MSTSELTCVIQKKPAMPSPFPGMDPYLEGEEWSDVHQALGAQIRKQLAPAIAPKYVARLAVATVPDYPHQQSSIALSH